MANSIFIFDLVINRICLEDERIENVKDLRISTAFNSIGINITSQNDTLQNFRSGGSCEFDAFPELLALEMKIFPLKMTLLYGDETIAKTCMKWPEKIIDQIDEKMGELMHCAQCTLQDKKSKELGTMDVLVRLQVKNKYESIKESEDKMDKLQALLNEGENFYVISEKNKDRESCSETPESSASSSWITPSELTDCQMGSIKNNKCRDNDFCDTCGKNANYSSADCHRLARVSKTKQSKSPCQTSAHKIREILDDNIFAKSPEPKPRLLDAGQIPKCCHSCKADLSWVPDYVPCPHCQYVPKKVETYNADMDSKQVLQMYVGTCQEEYSSSECRDIMEMERQEEMKKRKKKFTKRRVKRLKAGCERPPRCKNLNQERVNPQITAYIKSLLPPKQDKHLNCINAQKKVPKNKGWMWDLMTKGVHPNWKPGFIGKPIREIMSWFLGTSFPADSIPVSPYAGKKNLRARKSEEEDIVPEHLEPRPTLHIHKKNEEYTVTMRPLKDKEGIEKCANPYLEMKPISFKITKNPVLVAKRQLKRKLKMLGHHPCCCHLPISMCSCREFREKKQIMKYVDEECSSQNIPCCSETFEFSDVTDSESEVDFAVTPPIGRIKNEKCNKPDLAHISTQYEVKDWKVIPKFPIASGLAKLKKIKINNRNRPRAVLLGCPQNVQPPIIIPIVEKPPVDDKKKKKGKKGKGKKKGKK